MSNLLILGAGQHGRVAKEIAESMQCFENIAFLDDYAEYAVGKLTEYENFKKNSQMFFVAFGDNTMRMQWINTLEKSGCNIATLISDRAMVSVSAKIGAGTIVEPGVVVNTATEISKGSILSIGVLVDHDSIVGEGCHIESGAVVMPNQKVPAGTTVIENTVYKR